MSTCKGKFNSIETMGLVDGPGIRIVFFMQGCPLRCIFCHNPETWDKNAYTFELTKEEVLAKIQRYQNYFGKDGGVTFSGGEPLLQKEFLKEVLKLCKENNINTCIDTCGYATDYEEILKYTDIVLMDIKAYTKEDYQKITGNHNIDLSIKFLDTCLKLNKRVWIRQVIVPGINDNKEYILGLKEFLKPYSNIEKIELLPYHNLAISKYQKLNIPYSLKDTPNMDINKCKELEKLLK